MEFIIGFVLGGLIDAPIIYILLKRRYDSKTVKAYNNGYEIGRDLEKRAILDYIELLKNKPNEGSDA